ncbi:MAG: pyridoxamine 5'-phosphate oxidase family protein [Candidatus Binatia bacterium]
MAEAFIELTDQLIDFIRQQKVFFVATAPSDPHQTVNLSPKGYDCLRILDPKMVAYFDFPGSGNETATHIKDNGRLTMMFCSFGSKPMTVRLYGRGEVIGRKSEHFQDLLTQWGEDVIPWIRQIIVLHLHEARTSCGYTVPRFEFVEERPTYRRYCEANGPKGRLEKYM